MWWCVFVCVRACLVGEEREREREREREKTTSDQSRMGQSIVKISRE